MPRPLYPQERPSTHCTGGWVGPRAGQDMCKKSPWVRSTHRPARSQLLYQLSYPGPNILVHYFINKKISHKNKTPCLSLPCGDVIRLIFTFSYYRAKIHTLCKLLKKSNLNKHSYNCNPNKSGQPELLLHKLFNIRITTDLQHRSTS